MTCGSFHMSLRKGGRQLTSFAEHIWKLQAYGLLKVIMILSHCFCILGALLHAVDSLSTERKGLYESTSIGSRCHGCLQREVAVVAASSNTSSSNSNIDMRGHDPGVSSRKY